MKFDFESHLKISIRRSYILANKKVRVNIYSSKQNKMSKKTTSKGQSKQQTIFDAFRTAGSCTSKSNYTDKKVSIDILEFDVKKLYLSSVLLLQQIQQ